MAQSLDALYVRTPHRARRLVLSKCCLPSLLLIVLLVQGCATSGTQPADIPYKPYRERAQTHVQGDLTVTVSVPTAAEAEEIYGIDLAVQCLPDFAAVL